MAKQLIAHTTYSFFKIRTFFQLKMPSMFPIFGNPFPIFGNLFPIFENQFPVFGNLFPIIGNRFPFLLETFSFHLRMFPIHLETFPIQMETFLNRLETNVDQIMLCAGRTDGPTHRPSYRDEWTHLKRENGKTILSGTDAPTGRVTGRVTCTRLKMCC